MQVQAPATHLHAPAGLTACLCSFVHAEAGVQAMVQEGGIGRLLPALQSSNPAVCTAALRSLDRILNELRRRWHFHKGKEASP